MKRKILIADDEPRMLMLIQDFLGTEFDIIASCDGQEAVNNFKSHTIDLAILDIMMPKLSGLEVIKEIRKESDIPIILLTAKTTELDELTGFLTGADEYIKKPFSPSILKARVSAIIKRTYGNNDLTNVGCIQLDKQGAQIYVNHEALELSSTEYKLLCHFIDNKSIVMSRETLLNAVWGEDYIGTDRTVDTTINRLRIKLHSASHYIETVRGLGYKFEVHS